jgi:transposase-like protein
MSKRESKRKRKRYGPEFKRTAVARMRDCSNITDLTRELGIDRKMLYQWKWESEGRPTRQAQPTVRATSVESLRTENARLKKLVAEKELELDFFAGALQKIAARRQKAAGNGGTAFTTKSGRK